MEVPPSRILGKIDYSKLDHIKLGCKGVDWIHLTQNRSEWLSVKMTVLNLQGFFLLAEKFRLSSYQTNSSTWNLVICV
jgi:hypothetical protein